MDTLSQKILLVSGITFIFIISIFLLILAAGIIMLLLVYQKKQFQYLKEKEQLKATFEKEMLESKLEMQEQTFNTISREIHDNVGQLLSLAKVQLNIISQNETLDKTLLSDAKDSLSKAMIDLRDIAKSLNSERIQLFSLPEITGHELQRIDRAGIKLTAIHVEGKEQPVQEQKKLIIFRIIQEALHNILKHSEAENINVSFYYGEANVKIDIKDNGKGFDKELIGRDGLGLQNIVSRASLIGGEARIDSSIDHGTTITIISPYA